MRPQYRGMCAQVGRATGVCVLLTKVANGKQQGICVLLTKVANGNERIKVCYKSEQ